MKSYLKICDDLFGKCLKFIDLMGITTTSSTGTIQPDFNVGFYPFFRSLASEVHFSPYGYCSVLPTSEGLYLNFRRPTTVKESFGVAVAMGDMGISEIFFLRTDQPILPRTVSDVFTALLKPRSKQLRAVLTTRYPNVVFLFSGEEKPTPDSLSTLRYAKRPEVARSHFPVDFEEFGKRVAISSSMEEIRYLFSRVLPYYEVAEFPQFLEALLDRVNGILESDLGFAMAVLSFVSGLDELPQGYNNRVFNHMKTVIEYLVKYEIGDLAVEIDFFSIAAKVAPKDNDKTFVANAICLRIGWYSARNEVDAALALRKLVLSIDDSKDPKDAICDRLVDVLLPSVRIEIIAPVDDLMGRFSELQPGGTPIRKAVDRMMAIFGGCLDRSEEDLAIEIRARIAVLAPERDPLPRVIGYLKTLVDAAFRSGNHDSAIRRLEVICSLDTSQREGVVRRSQYEAERLFSLRRDHFAIRVCEFAYRLAEEDDRTRIVVLLTRALGYQVENKNKPLIRVIRDALNRLSGVTIEVPDALSIEDLLDRIKTNFRKKLIPDALAICRFLATERKLPYEYQERFFLLMYCSVENLSAVGERRNLNLAIVVAETVGVLRVLPSQKKRLTGLMVGRVDEALRLADLDSAMRLRDTICILDASRDPLRDIFERACVLVKKVSARKDIDAALSFLRNIFSEPFLGWKGEALSLVERIIGVFLMTGEIDLASRISDSIPQWDQSFDREFVLNRLETIFAKLLEERNAASVVTLLKRVLESSVSGSRKDTVLDRLNCSISDLIENGVADPDVLEGRGRVSLGIAVWDGFISLPLTDLQRATLANRVLLLTMGIVLGKRVSKDEEAIKPILFMNGEQRKVAARQLIGDQIILRETSVRRGEAVARLCEVAYALVSQEAKKDSIFRAMMSRANLCVELGNAYAAGPIYLSIGKLESSKKTGVEDFNDRLFRKITSKAGDCLSCGEINQAIELYRVLYIMGDVNLPGKILENIQSYLRVEKFDQALRLSNFLYDLGISSFRRYALVSILSKRAIEREIDSRFIHESEAFLRSDDAQGNFLAVLYSLIFYVLERFDTLIEFVDALDLPDLLTLQFKSEALRKKRKYADAISLSNSLIERSVGVRDLDVKLRALTCRGYCYFHEKKFDEALSDFAEASTFASEIGINLPPRIAAGRALVYLELGRIDDARESISVFPVGNGSNKIEHVRTLIDEASRREF